MKHRIRAAGLLIKDDAILLIKHTDHNGTWWVPPGGGLEATDEDTRATVVREVLEESGLTVTKLGPLVYAREFKEAYADTYHMEQFLLVEDWEGDITLENLKGLGGDEQMISEARFVSRDEMQSLKVFPEELKDDVWSRIQGDVHAIHLGVTTDDESPA